MQRVVAVDVTTDLNLWCRATPGFEVGGNEAGMKLGDEIRGADGAIWRKSTEPKTHAFARTPPLLAVEIMGLFAEFQQVGTTVLIASHDLPLIKRMKKRVVVLDHGRLVADVAAEEIL